MRIAKPNPAESPFSKGGLLVLLALFCLLGCGQSQKPSIPVREIHHWQMPPAGSMIPAPRALAVSKDKSVIVLDTAGRLLVFDENGTLLRQWKMPESEIGAPEDIIILKDGAVAVADTHYHRVIIFDQEGTILTQFGSYGTEAGQFLYPVSIAEDNDGNLYVSEYGSNDRIQKFTRDGSPILSFGGFGTEPGEFQRPSGIIWHNGNIYVADAVNNRIQAFKDTGEFLRILNRPADPLNLQFPYGITMDGHGAIYVVEWGAGRISKIDTEGKLLGRYGSPGAGEGQFRTPWGIAFDTRGRIRVADTGNRRIVDLIL